MTSNVFEQLLTEQIRIFRSAFSSVSRTAFYDEHRQTLIHAGEFGTYREAICKDFLRFFVPSRLDISQGFLINASDKVSTQCDVIVYDSASTPLIQSESRQRFFPIETTCAVGEVKSSLSKEELKLALHKLAVTKQMREDIASPSIIRSKHHTYDPKNNIYDRLFTFLICEDLRFDPLNLDMDAVYGQDVPYRLRHNLILSINDGLFLYRDTYNEDRKIVQWSEVYQDGASRQFPSCLVRPTTSEDNGHFKGFVSYTFMATSGATILYPEVTDYMDHRGGELIDLPSTP